MIHKILEALRRAYKAVPGAKEHLDWLAKQAHHADPTVVAADDPDPKTPVGPPTT